MGVTKKPALWVAGDEMFPKISNAPASFVNVWIEWHEDDDPDGDLSFSKYWNKNYGYPQLRWYQKRSAWRIYFDNEADLIAWLLGVDLSPN